MPGPKDPLVKAMLRCKTCHKVLLNPTVLQVALSMACEPCPGSQQEVVVFKRPYERRSAMIARGDLVEGN